MPNQASGIFKQVAFKREVTYGTIPAAASAQLLRRVTSTLDLSKDVYQSNEIRPDFQIADYRHGVRRVKGGITGELSPGTYSDMLAVALKREFTAGVSASGLSITIAAGSGVLYTVTRAAGSFITDGFKLGDVIRLSVGGFNVANLAKNLMIVALTATIATVIVLNASALVPEGPIATSTVSVVNKKTFIPTTGQTDVSYAIEHWFGDISQSEVFSGCKIDKCAISLPPTGLATLQLDMLGQNITPAQVRYFTSPTGITTSGVVAAVNGVLVVNGSAQAAVTGLQLTIDPSFSADPVVGSNVLPNMFAGPVRVSGQFSCYFTDQVLRDLFVNETESSLMVALTTSNAANADFVSFVLPRIKVGGEQKSDGTAGIIQTFPFEALINLTNGGAGFVNEATTISVQDSLA